LDELGQDNCPICLENIFENNPNENNLNSQQRLREKAWDMLKEDFNVTILCSHVFNWKCLVGWCSTHTTTRVLDAIASEIDNS
jgi:hypothetical protein